MTDWTTWQEYYSGTVASYVAIHPSNGCSYGILAWGSHPGPWPVPHSAPTPDHYQFAQIKAHTEVT